MHGAAVLRIVLYTARLAHRPGYSAAMACSVSCVALRSLHCSRHVSDVSLEAVTVCSMTWRANRPRRCGACTQNVASFT